MAESGGESWVGRTVTKLGRVVGEAGGGFVGVVLVEGGLIVVTFLGADGLLHILPMTMVGAAGFVGGLLWGVMRRRRGKV